jgi:hypothetical protein
MGQDHDPVRPTDEDIGARFALIAGEHDGHRTDEQDQAQEGETSRQQQRAPERFPGRILREAPVDQRSGKREVVEHRSDFMQPIDRIGDEDRGQRHSAGRQHHQSQTQIADHATELGNDRRAERQATDRQGDKRELHHPAKGAEFILADEPPGRIEISPQAVQTGQEEEERPGSGKRNLRGKSFALAALQTAHGWLGHGGPQGIDHGTLPIVTSCQLIAIILFSCASCF